MERVKRGAMPARYAVFRQRIVKTRGERASALSILKNKSGEKIQADSYALELVPNTTCGTVEAARIIQRRLSAEERIRQAAREVTDTEQTQAALRERLTPEELAKRKLAFGTIEDTLERTRSRHKRERLRRASETSVRFVYIVKRLTVGRETLAGHTVKANTALAEGLNLLREDLRKGKPLNIDKRKRPLR